MANPTDPGNKPIERGKRSKPKDVWKLLPEVWALIRPQRAILAVGLVLMGINRVSGLVLPASTKYLIDDVIGKRQIHLLGIIVLVVIAATAMQGGTSFLLTQLLSKAAQRMIAELRCKIQAHVGHLPVAFYDANKTGALVARIMSDVEGVRNLIGTGLIEFAGGLMTALFALIVLLRISAAMTAAVAVVLLLFGLRLYASFKTIRPLFRARSRINAEVSGRLTESLGGVRVVKGYHAEEREEKVFATGVQRLLDNVMKTLTSISLMNLAATTLMGIVSATIMYFGARHILSGTMTLGTLLTYVFFLALLIAPVLQIVSVGSQISEALAGLERAHEVLSEKTEVEASTRKVRLDRIEGQVVFENVNFAYSSGKPVLHDIQFESRPGTVTALVGPSGAGKSTVIGLIAAFYVPTSGRVLIDGVDLAQVRLDSYRTQLGVVLQETFLFDGTIRDNVAFSRPAASEREILAVCRIAGVDEFAQNLEMKYDTVVGERGVRLSGGQKQRVSIARAILADPRILILDEATSSLDSESEALIQEGLSYLMQGRTTFVIAHRLSTVRRADQILVLEAGRIIERGTHQSLYAARGRYYDLYTKQHGIEANLFLPTEEQGSKPEETPIDVEQLSNGSPKDSALLDGIRLIRGREN
ncbi:MAG: ABC transporter ATP-binding protein [Terriglobales bacterium]